MGASLHIARLLEMPKGIKDPAAALAKALKQVPNLPDEAGIRLSLVCALLACSPATVWRLAQTGKIKTRKPSRRVTVFSLGSIRALLGED
jgi:hypothetical protein